MKVRWTHLGMSWYQTEVTFTGWMEQKVRKPKFLSAHLKVLSRVGLLLFGLRLLRRGLSTFLGVLTLKYAK